MLNYNNFIFESMGYDDRRLVIHIHNEQEFFQLMDDLEKEGFCWGGRQYGPAKQYCMPNQVDNIRKKLKDLEISDNVVLKKPPLDGSDIMKILNIDKGPMVGKMLKKLKDIYLENPKITKEDAEKIIKKEYDKSFRTI